MFAKYLNISSTNRDRGAYFGLVGLTGAQTRGPLGCRVYAREIFRNLRVLELAKNAPNIKGHHEIVYNFLLFCR